MVLILAVLMASVMVFAAGTTARTIALDLTAPANLKLTGGVITVPAQTADG